jgi:tetratricopeptide (TPR) repeat protein
MKPTARVAPAAGVKLAGMSDDLEQLFAGAYHARREHRFADARRLLTEAVEHARRGDIPEVLARALTALGQIERDMTNTQAALQLYQEAVEIYHKQSDMLRLAHTVRHVGDIYREDGQLAPAEPCYEGALRMYRANPDTPPLDLANTLRGFALLKEQLGQKQQARDLWTEARDLYRSVDVEAGVNESTRRLAQLS